MTATKFEIAVLGPLGTYTHEAAFKGFGTDATYAEQASIADVFHALSPNLPLGVIPQENSIFGTVVETYDLLRTSQSAFIRGEIVLKVEHCLLVKKGVQLHQIQKVLSHEQALGQCRDFLSKMLPKAKTVKTKSTAAAAQELLENPPNCAAICSSICAQLLPELEILFTAVQNERSNFTRFYVIAHSQHESIPRTLTYEMKALLRISSNSAGILDTPSNVMSRLISQNILIRRIDRRPSLDSIPFSSIYFLEVYADVQQQPGLSFESWTEEIDAAASKMGVTDRTVSVLGIW
ncbi:PDT-domain-containing protein [Pholiota conissans]|uniref:prephenate dehydratase n=1 Tax=Pholiota conissans TaxID=109636 RepID=A0A9P5YQY3_9AGAR|nr:PDT-domain-containing protein [Pholiota conissans]